MIKYCKQAADNEWIVMLGQSGSLTDAVFYFLLGTRQDKIPGSSRNTNIGLVISNTSNYRCTLLL